MTLGGTPNGLACHHRDLSTAFRRRLSWLSAGILWRQRVQSARPYLSCAVNFLAVQRTANGFVFLLGLSSTNARSRSPGVDAVSTGELKIEVSRWVDKGI